MNRSTAIVSAALALALAGASAATPVRADTPTRALTENSRMQAAEQAHRDVSRGLHDAMQRQWILFNAVQAGRIRFQADVAGNAIRTGQPGAVRRQALVQLHNDAARTIARRFDPGFPLVGAALSREKSR